MAQKTQKEMKIFIGFVKTKNRFRILSDWKITKIKSCEYSGFTSISPVKKSAIVYDWTKGQPADFYIHEILHVALRALLRIDRRKVKELRTAEEDLIQDICSLLVPKRV